jgi:hypothetical protein
METIIIGVLCVLFGIYTIIDTYTDPPCNPEDRFLLIKPKGYIGGIGLIILGLGFIFGWISW